MKLLSLSESLPLNYILKNDLTQRTTAFFFNPHQLEIQCHIYNFLSHFMAIWEYIIDTTIVFS